MTKSRKLRSRSGCISCKKLKIKCSEGRPRCEYCLHTGRDCQYLRSEDALQIQFYTNTTPTVYKHLTSEEYVLYSHFVNHCVQQHVFARIPRVEAAWRKNLPKLFTSSNVVRQSVFAYTALQLLPTMRSPEVASWLRLQLGSTKPNQKNTVAQIGEEVSVLQFFQNTIILHQEKAENAIVAQCPESLSEVVLSGGLLIGFITDCPFRLLPLVRFEDDPEWKDELPVDFLSFYQGYRDVYLPNKVNLNSQVRHIVKESEDVLYTSSYTSLPISRYLWSLLAARYPMQLINNENVDLVKDYSQSVMNLERYINSTLRIKNPVALQSWIRTFSRFMIQSIRQKDLLALQFLFIAASLCALTSSKRNNINIWTNFLRWYATNRRMNEMESNLYSLIVDRRCRVAPDQICRFGSFDPKEALQDLDMHRPSRFVFVKPI